MRIIHNKIPSFSFTIRKDRLDVVDFVEDIGSPLEYNMNYFDFANSRDDVWQNAVTIVWNLLSILPR